MTEIIVKNSDRPMLVDDCDAELVRKYKWRLSPKGYVETSSRGTLPGNPGAKTLLAHRIIMDAKPTEQVDHINHDKLDNRRANLRTASGAENMRNRGPRQDNRSGYIGVAWNKQACKWVAKIQHSGKMIYLGSFDNAEDAATVWNFAADQYHGDFAVMNEPLEPSAWASDAMMQEYDADRYMLA